MITIPAPRLERIIESELVYLACPYAHPDAKVREHRFATVSLVAGHLVRQGRIVFSPITHWHTIAAQMDLPKGWDFWKRLDLSFLERATLLMVLKLEGWMESVGVRDEIIHAAQMGISVEYLEPSEVLR